MSFMEPFNCCFAAGLFFTTYESVKVAMGFVGLSSQFSLASLVMASCCGETVCNVVELHTVGISLVVNVELLTVEPSILAALNFGV